MSSNTCTAVSVPAYLECQICFDSWRNPVQLLTCGHIFCGHCAGANGARCFICRSEVTGTQSPGEKMVEAARAVPVVCSSCGWRGTRKAAATHRCDSREVNSIYARYPLLSDEERVRSIIASREGAAAASAGGPTVVSAATVVGDGAVPTQYEGKEVVTGVPL